MMVVCRTAGGSAAAARTDRVVIRPERDVTGLLLAWKGGDSAALDQLIPSSDGRGSARRDGVRSDLPDGQHVPRNVRREERLPGAARRARSGPGGRRSPDHRRAEDPGLAARRRRDRRRTRGDVARGSLARSREVERHLRTSALARTSVALRDERVGGAAMRCAVARRRGTGSACGHRIQNRSRGSLRGAVAESRCRPCSSAHDPR